jgi:hypothetical protein
MADLPGGPAGYWCRLQRQEADKLVTRIDPGVVSPVAELRGHGRQGAQEFGQWKTHHEVRKVIDASPAANQAGDADDACGV